MTPPADPGSAPPAGVPAPAGDVGVLEEAIRRPPYLAAALTALAVLLLYVVTLAPTTAFWDTSEYIATAHILGIPHPPGNPLFVALARTWEVLLTPLGLSVAVRINLFAAVTSALASGFLFLVAHRLLAALGGPRWAPVLGAAAAAWLGATAFTVWNQSNVNEKVYTVSVLVIAAVSWLAVRWKDRREEPGSLRYLLVAVYLLALGSTNHLMSVLPLPALGLLVLLVAPSVLLDRRLWTRGVLLVVVGLSFNFFLPIRAERDPVINEADPTCESVLGAAAAVYTGGRAGCDALASSLTREQYAKPPLTERQARFGSQLLNYFQYFGWQWARGMAADPAPGTARRLPFTLFFLALGLFGLWAVWRADREVFAYLGVLLGTVTLGLVFYLNFKYGYSLAPEVADPNLHEVRERDYFFIAGFLLWGVLAGIGLGRVWGIVAESVSGGVEDGRGWALASPVLLVALIPLMLNWSWASRSGDYAARDWAYDLLMSVEPYGVLFTNGDNDTFPLWYLQEVEEVRPDVTVIVVQYLYTTWYPKQLQELTTAERQRPYRPVEGAEDLYPREPAEPTGPITSADPDLMDRVGSSALQEDLVVALGDQLAVSYPAGTFLDRGDRLALRIIHDSLENGRPVYFAGTTGLMSTLGLDRWGVRHGLASKLLPVPPEERSDTTLVRISPSLGGDWFDVDRSLTLAEDVYAYRALLDRGVWTDRSTLNIPWQFYAFFVQLSDAARIDGQDPALVQRLQEMAAEFMITAEGGHRGSLPPAPAQ